jgi:hypothetical protein
VGIDLEDGGFIQFGYHLPSIGYYCMGGGIINGRSTCWESPTNIRDADARWFWEYFPVATGGDYYYQVGLEVFNGTWHTYSILPFHNQTTGWEFLLDGKYASSLEAPISVAKTPIYVSAEHVTTEFPARLGPVEFKDLRYLTPNGWKSVEALYASIGCGVNTPCNFPNPYGVMALGPNHIVAGSEINQSATNGKLLWASTFSSSTRVLTTTASLILSTGSTITATSSLASSLVIIAIVAVAYTNRKGLQPITKKLVSILSLPPPQPVEKTDSIQQRTDSKGATYSDIMDGIEEKPSGPVRPIGAKALLVLAILHVAVLALFMRSVFMIMEGHRLGTYASQVYLESLSGMILLLIFFVLMAFSISWLAAGIGLLIITRWGWKLTLVLAAIGIAYSLWSLRFGNWFSGILVLVVESVVIYCLTHQHVKAYFANTEASNNNSD